jgi:hypothetical protein
MESYKPVRGTATITIRNLTLENVCVTKLGDQFDVPFKLSNFRFFDEGELNVKRVKKIAAITRPPCQRHRNY